MSRVIGGARPWNESEARVGQRHTPRPPTSALIDAPRQSNFSLRASFFAVNIATAATPDSHPDCRALLIQIVALQSTKLKRAGYRSRYRLRKQIVEPVFGQIKQARGFRQFLLRGIDKVKAEWALICTAHNLVKLARAA